MRKNQEEKYKQTIIRLHGALKRITKYQTPKQMRRSSDRDWGLPFEECIVMAYENIQQEAESAIKGVRIPKGSQ